jgi:hypothetical protein
VVVWQAARENTIMTTANRANDLFHGFPPAYFFDILQHLYWVEQPVFTKNTRKIDAIDSLVIASSKRSYCTIIYVSKQAAL